MKLSFNVNADKLGDRSYFLDLMRDLQPNSVLLMGWDRSLINDVQKATPNTKIVVRFPGDEEHVEWAYGEQNADNHINSWIRQGWTDVWHCVLNEPDIFVPGNMRLSHDNLKGVLDYLIYFMDTACPRGLKLVVGNFGPGTWQALDIDMGLWDAFLHKAGYWSEQGMVYVGYHPYMAPIGPGTNWNPDMYLEPDKSMWWPTKAQLPSERINGALPPYYSALRHVWMDIRCREIGAPLHNKMETEKGHDRLDSLENYTRPDGSRLNVYHEIWARYGHLPLPQLKGQLSYEAYWKVMFPQWDVDEAMFYQYKWDVEMSNDTVDSVFLFTWSLNEEFTNQGFNMVGHPKFHNLLIAYAKSLRETPPPDDEDPPIEIPPEDTTMYDFANYLGDGRIYRNVNTWGEGPELVQTQREGNEVFIVKNQNWEQLGVTSTHIRRGVDTSPAPGLLYIQFENEHSPIIGANWSPRYLKVGQRWENRPYVRYYKDQLQRQPDGTMREQEVGDSYYGFDAFHVKAHHAHLTLPSNISLQNVLEIDWIVGNIVRETYWYAEDYGLVMWRGLQGQAYMDTIYLADDQPDLTRKTVWLTEPPRILPSIGDPVSTPPPAEIWTDLTIEPVDVWANVRLLASTKSAIIAEIRGVTTVQQSKSEFPDWYFIKTPKGETGFLFKGAVRVPVVTTPPVDPPPTPEFFIKVTEAQKAALIALLEQIA